MMGTYVRNFGGKVLNEAKNMALYGDDPNAIRGAEFGVDLHTRYKVTPTAEARKLIPQGSNSLAVEIVAMLNNYFGGIAVARQVLGPDKIDFAPPPKGPKGIRQARVAGNAWSVLSLSKAKDASWEVLRWLHTREGLLSPQLTAIAWPPTIWAAKSPQRSRGNGSSSRPTTRTSSLPPRRTRERVSTSPRPRGRRPFVRSRRSRRSRRRR
ncbi:MAG: hypothetical protein HY332_00250 [Chloroflexi bacterium]|nr:hypothetical protein [Chloroflexota bacterium]